MLKYGEYRNYRSSHRGCSLRKIMLKNFSKFTGKPLSQSPFLNSQSSFLNKLAGLSPATLLKKILWHRLFSVNFRTFFKETFFTEHLTTTASETTTKCFRLKSISSIKDDCSFTLVIYLFKVFQRKTIILYCKYV